jgi:Flp pilus assembly protein TadD
MKQFSALFLVATTLTLSACGQAGQQWLDPDKTFALFDQPVVKGVNATQEEMASKAFANGDFLKAAQLYQQMLGSEKTTPEQQLRYKLAMADATRRAGKQEEALRMYEELVRDFPQHVEVQEGLGLTRMATGKVAEAGTAFAVVMEKDPKRWRTLNGLGILFVAKNMVPEAMAYYNEALLYSPENAAILNNMALSQAVDRNFPRASQAFERAILASKQPAQRKQIEMNYAMVLGISGNFEDARTLASKYLEGATLDNNLGLYAHLAKDEALAKAYLNMALSQSTSHYPRAWENLDLVNDAGKSGL